MRHPFVFTLTSLAACVLAVAAIVTLPRLVSADITTRTSALACHLPPDRAPLYLLATGHAPRVHHARHRHHSGPYRVTRASLRHATYGG